jgi:hypothetical protein
MAHINRNSNTDSVHAAAELALDNGVCVAVAAGQRGAVVLTQADELLRHLLALRALELQR